MRVWTEVPSVMSGGKRCFYTYSDREAGVMLGRVVWDRAVGSWKCAVHVGAKCITLCYTTTSAAGKRVVEEDIARGRKVGVVA